jgi:hypothetical protein
MIYNSRMMHALAFALLLAAAPARAADAKADDAGTADATTVQLADYFIKTSVADANPKLVTPFLAVDPATLPKRQRVKAAAKQVEIKTLFKLHDTKKKGNWLQATEGCSLKDIVKPLKDIPLYTLAGYGDIKEDEEQYIMHKTQCTEIDMGCQFSLIIFFDKGKPRRLMLQEHDPLNALAAESHKPAGQTNFFGTGLTCAH